MVGSGVGYEADLLKAAEKQLLEQMTVIGTRQNVVDSTINFHSMLSETNEGFKASSMGSRQIDITKVITDFNRAQQAYQAGLTTSTQAGQLSILDFLR